MGPTVTRSLRSYIQYSVGPLETIVQCHAPPREGMVNLKLALTSFFMIDPIAVVFENWRSFLPASKLAMCHTFNMECISLFSRFTAN